MDAIAVPRPAPRVGAFLLVWLLVAIAAGATGLVERFPLPLPGLALALTAALLIALWSSASLRAWVWSRGPEQLVALHLSRVVGAAFLVLAARGELPPEWALPSGWGDLAVAALAVPVLLWGAPFRTAGQRRALLLWNVFGLADIMMVLGGGVRMILLDPTVGGVMQRLPMSLLPTFLVPLILASHVMVFAWLVRTSPGAGGRSARWE